MKRNIANFLLGLFGGLIAIFTPKMFSIMALEPGRHYSEVISNNYLLGGFLLAATIGGLVLVRYTTVYEEPWKIVVLAISLPGVLSSGLSAQDSQNRLQEMAKNKSHFEESFERRENIPAAQGLELPLSQNSQAWPSLVGTAMAQDGCEWSPLEKQSGLLKEEQKDTRLVLSTHTTQADAQAAQAAFNSKGIPSRLAASGGRFFLLACGEWKTKGQVLLDASELKKTIQQTPELKKRVSGTPSYYQAK